MRKPVIATICVALFLFLSACFPGYKTVPEKLTLGFPIWFGGPSMTWSYEKKPAL